MGLAREREGVGKIMDDSTSPQKEAKIVEYYIAKRRLRQQP